MNLIESEALYRETLEAIVREADRFATMIQLRTKRLDAEAWFRRFEAFRDMAASALARGQAVGRDEPMETRTTT